MMHHLSHRPAAVSILATLVFAAPAFAQTTPTSAYYGTVTGKRLAICGLDIPLAQPNAAALIGEACRKSGPTTAQPKGANVMFVPQNLLSPNKKNPVIMPAPGWAPLPKPRSPGDAAVRPVEDVAPKLKPLNDAFKVNPAMRTPGAMGGPG